MAEPILKLTRGVPKTDREWMDVFKNLTKFFRVSGDELLIGGAISLPDASVGTNKLVDLAVTTAKLAGDSVTNDKLRDSAALSLVGRASNSGGNPGDIVSTVDDTFMVRRGAALTWGAIADGDIPATIARDSEVATVSAALSAHEAAGDPHPQYLTQTEGDAQYALYSTGSFTVTLTGCTTSPTETMRYVKCGSSVILSLDSSLTAVSNATTATLTGMPSNLYPARTQTAVIRIRDNGVSAFGLAEISTSGVISLFPTAVGGSFTAAGDKGVLRTSWPYLTV